MLGSPLQLSTGLANVLVGSRRSLVLLEIIDGHNPSSEADVNDVAAVPYC
jgi:hypothetical protein